MAKFNIELPNDILKDIKYVDDNYLKIFGGMTQEGAEVVYENIMKNAPSQIKNNREIIDKLKITKVYKTPSDDGINSKVLFSGYFINEKGEKTPVPLIINMFEYGNYKKSDTYPKKPFFRKSFKKKQIEMAMMKAQKELSGGLLDE